VYSVTLIDDEKVICTSGGRSFETDTDALKDAQRRMCALDEEMVRAFPEPVTLRLVPGGLSETATAPTTTAGEVARMVA
jgi:hypothetical protein